MNITIVYSPTHTHPVKNITIVYSPTHTHRKGDVPWAVHTPRAAAVVAGQLLPLHGLPHHTSVQPGGGVDRLQPARVPVAPAGEMVRP